MKSKKPTNIRHHTIKSLHKRLDKLDKIEKSHNVTTYFSIFALLISMTFAIFALSISLNSLQVFWTGYFLFLLAATTFGIMIGYIYVIMRKPKR